MRALRHGDSRLYLADTQTESVALLKEINAWLGSMQFTLVSGRKKEWLPDGTSFKLPERFREYCFETSVSVSINLFEGLRMKRIEEGRIVEGLDPVVSLELSHDSQVVLWKGIFLALVSLDGGKGLANPVKHNGRIFLNPSLPDGDYGIQFVTV